MTLPKMYLSGAMDGKSYEEKHDWRETVKDIWGEDDCLDPTRRVYQGPGANWVHAADIVQLDKVDIVRCEIVFVYYKEPTAGTCQEVLYGWELGKLVTIACETEEVYKRLSPWMIYHSAFQGVGIQKSIDFIRNYYGLLVPAFVHSGTH